MQRTKPGEREGYAARRLLLRERKGISSQPSHPATTQPLDAYRVRVRNGPQPAAGTWGEYITRLRMAARLSRPQLADRIKVDHSTVWRWEKRGAKLEDPDVAEAIAALFGLDVDDVLIAAGMKRASGGVTPTEPPRPPDPEMDWVLAQDLDEETKAEVVELLLQRRQQDSDRRMQDLRLIVEQVARRNRRRGA